MNPAHAPMADPTMASQNAMNTRPMESEMGRGSMDSNMSSATEVGMGAGTGMNNLHPSTVGQRNRPGEMNNDHHPDDPSPAQRDDTAQEHTHREHCHGPLAHLVGHTHPPHLDDHVHHHPVHHLPAPAAHHLGAHHHAGGETGLASYRLSDWSKTPDLFRYTPGRAGEQE